MLSVGLTGGIGSGKSTFAALLAERGARLIDADKIGHEALATGTQAWHSIVDTFGHDVLAPSLAIDRPALARIVFADKDKLLALNTILHPIILGTIAQRLDELRGTNEIVVIDAALIVELGLDRGLDVLVVVVAPEEARISRTARERGLTPSDVTARAAVQASEEELLAKADIVVHNGGTLEDLQREADRVWTELIDRLAT